MFLQVLTAVCEIQFLFQVLLFLVWRQIYYSIILDLAHSERANVITMYPKVYLVQQIWGVGHLSRPCVRSSKVIKGHQVNI